MKELFLDIETSGTDPAKHSVLSIGMVVSLNGLEDYQSFYREIEYGELAIMPESIAVNKFDFTDRKNKTPLLQADKEAVDFLKKYYPGNITPMPVGLNIGGFDLQFINRHMPLLSKKLSHRSVELNTLIYILAEKHSMEFLELKKELSDKATSTVEKLGLGISKHNALFDAVFNLCLYSLIKRDILILPL